jgi:ribonuclease P protein component
VNWLTLAGISKTGMGSAGDRNLMSRKLKHNVIEAITELLQEIDNCHSQVAEQALEHIHQKYVSVFNLICSFFRVCNHFHNSLEH